MRKQIKYIPHLRSVVGGSIASFSLIMGVYLAIVPAETPIQAQGTTLNIPIIVDRTENGPAKTVPEFIRVSQGFHAIHPGADITAKEGASIYPIRAGKVLKITISKFDYGRAVIVDHGDGLVSLYAHMGKIKVDEGQNVTDKTVLGEVGLTGHTTGYHLHLEIRKNGSNVNPLTFLRKPNDKLASLGQTKPLR
jgi:murein DD-endopeptidase MepM/ murein hydrolase activator NlpD